MMDETLFNNDPLGDAYDNERVAATYGYALADYQRAKNALIHRDSPYADGPLVQEIAKLAALMLGELHGGMHVQNVGDSLAIIANDVLKASERA